MLAAPFIYSGDPCSRYPYLEKFVFLAIHTPDPIDTHYTMDAYYVRLMANVNGNRIRAHT